MGYYGAVGILFGLAQNAVISHNLIHDTAYTGLVLCGNEDPALAFAKDNLIEYNHIHHVMKVTVDGSAMYLSFPPELVDFVPYKVAPLLAGTGGMADGWEGSGAASPGYFLDDGPLAKGEVHGVDGASGSGLSPSWRSRAFPEACRFHEFSAP